MNAFFPRKFGYYLFYFPSPTLFHKVKNVKFVKDIYNFSGEYEKNSILHKIKDN